MDAVGKCFLYLDIPMFGFTFLLWVVLLHNSLIAKKLKKSTLNGRTNDELSSLLLNREPLKSVAVVKSGAIKMTFITRQQCEANKNFRLTFWRLL